MMQSSSYSTPSTTTPRSVIASTPIPLVSTSVTGRPVGIGRAVAADVDRRRGPLEHVEVLRRLAEMRDALHRRGPRADDADPLVVQAVEGAVAVAAGVLVVPAAGVGGVGAGRLHGPGAREGPAGER